MDTKYKVIIVTLVFATGLATGRFTLPAKVVEKEKIVVQEKVVEKIVYSQDVKKKDDKTYHRTTIKLPDGTIKTETTIVDKDVTTVTTDTTLSKEEAKTSTIEKEKTTTNNTKDWVVSVTVSSNVDKIFNNSYTPALGLLIQRRIIGPIYLGAFGSTDKTFGLSAGLIF